MSRCTIQAMANLTDAGITFQVVNQVVDVCEICDRPGDLITTHGVAAHAGCLPAHWREEADS